MSKISVASISTNHRHISIKFGLKGLGIVLWGALGKTVTNIWFCKRRKIYKPSEQLPDLQG